MRIPIAIFASDLHFSHQVPTARSAEPDWYAAQARPLLEMLRLQDELEVPVLIAGDIFDRWNSPPSIVNFIAETIGKNDEIYAIPGQHDLPNHSLEEIQRSAYWSLCLCRSIYNITPENPVSLGGGILLHGFPWGCPLKPVEDAYKGKINIALVHSYVWSNPENSYPGAPEEKTIWKYRDALKSYSAAAFGDNHKGFLFGNNSCINCGTFMRRKQDERGHKPMLGILHDDMKIKPYYLDTSQDKWIDPEEKAMKSDFNPDKFIAELRSLGSDSLDFRSALKYHLDKKQANNRVRDLVENSLL